MKLIQRLAIDRRIIVLVQRVLIASVMIFQLACSGDDLAGSSTVTGSYRLRTINGASLPFTVPGGGAVKTEVMDGVINLYEGFTFAESGNWRITTNGQVSTTTISKTGSYSLLGIKVILSASDGGQPRITTVEGTTMTIVEAGMTWVFRK
jgi:hypothetical protein